MARLSAGGHKPPTRYPLGRSSPPTDALPRSFSTLDLRIPDSHAYLDVDHLLQLHKLDWRYITMLGHVMKDHIWCKVGFAASVIQNTDF